MNALGWSESKHYFKEGVDYEKTWGGSKCYYKFVHEVATHVLFDRSGMAKDLASSVYVAWREGCLLFFTQTNHKYVRFTNESDCVSLPIGRLFGCRSIPPGHTPYGKRLKYLGWAKRCAVTDLHCGLHIPDWYNRDWTGPPQVIECTEQEWNEIIKYESDTALKYCLSEKVKGKRLSEIADESASSYEILRWSRDARCFIKQLEKCGVYKPTTTKKDYFAFAKKAIQKRIRRKQITEKEQSFFQMILSAKKLSDIYKTKASA
jgi:hypothetical protein